jgi:solute carrier family 27 (fatty acid transporter), member 1/4
VAVAASYWAGATVVLRRKFSASAFLPDIVAHRCTAVAYIGELWRYVQLQPPSSLDRAHAIKVIVGNGLRASTWTGIVARCARS